MELATVPLLLALAGLTLYLVLGGADFGAGFWQLVAPRGEHGARIRTLAHESMAPVWEANHVWLIFVLVVMWTAYPEALASIASTLVVPLFIGAVGIIFRGATYALRAGAARARELRAIDVTFAISSILTPFALATIVGAIATGEVPVGNAAGDEWSSWTNPTSLMVGALAVATSAYLAAVYLAADAVRRGDPLLAAAFRTRALASGVVAGAAAAAGLVVLRSDARELFDDLVSGAGLPALIVSAAAGIGTLALVVARRYEPARYSAALAVAAIVVGWALAQAPLLLPPDLTVSEAAADDETLVAVIVAVLAGAVLLFPALALLFMLTLRGALGYGEPPHVAPTPSAPGGLRLLGPTRRALLGRVAAALFIAGTGLLTFTEGGLTQALGLVCLFGFGLAAFGAAVPVGPHGAEPSDEQAETP